MMLTLDEAITHAKEVAKVNRDKAEGYSRGEDYEQIKANECAACAEEHEQLASWLEELKKYKAQKIIIKVKPQEAKTLEKLLKSSQFGIAYPDTQYEVAPIVRGGQLVAWLTELQERREADKWVNAKERKPEKDGAYLVVVEFQHLLLTTYYDAENEHWGTANGVIAWRPLPEYKESEDEK